MTEAKLQGRVVDIERTGNKFIDEQGNTWERCVFTVELTGFSLRTPDRQLPEKLKGSKVKLTRFVCHDWHLKIGARETLDPSETEAVLRGGSTDNIWLEE